MKHYYAIVRSTDHLAHYGVKGMKWGVRKALIKGNERQLDRHFRKAAKKLKKLQKLGLGGQRNAAKAVAYGAAAAGTGTIAVGGTNVPKAMINRLASITAKGSAIARAYYNDDKSKTHLNALADKLQKRSESYGRQDKKLDTWAKQKREYKLPVEVKGDDGKLTYTIQKKQGLSNNDKLRLGMAMATVGLAGKAVQSAYRAKNAGKYMQKAVEFKNAMDETFAGTKYEGQYVKPPRRRKRRG